ncbi:MAG: ABC transporter ATP-binding protein [Thermoplasmata archaeon]|nr:ABC transporter ATP-binding protein [Thermoplasmata archaeon]
MSSSECLRVRGLSAAWGTTPVLTDVDLDVNAGELVVLMGPNGSGKTTLLRTIVGLEPHTSGTVALRGQSLDDVPTHRRGIGMLFQEPALFPNRSVWENVAYGLELTRRPREQVERRVDAMLDLLRLSALADRRPDALSGGERQRVALARTLAPEPPGVLLDEPDASVDVEIRTALRSEFRRALASTGTAALHVTHDREEGLSLADRVILLSEGRVAQAGAPDDVYQTPANAGVARFLGYNVISDRGTTLAIAPEDIELGPPDSGGTSGIVSLNGFAGRDRIVEVTLPDGVRVECRTSQGTGLAPVGARVSLRWKRSVALA